MPAMRTGPFPADVLESVRRGLRRRGVTFTEEPQGDAAFVDVPDTSLDVLAALLRATEYELPAPERVLDTARNAAKELGLAVRTCTGMLLEITTATGAQELHDLAPLVLAGMSEDDEALHRRAVHRLDSPPPEPAEDLPEEDEEDGPEEMPRDDLYPGIATEEGLRELLRGVAPADREEVSLRVLPLCGDLYVVVWLDHGSRRQLITGRHELLWAASLEAIFEAATENLATHRTVLEREGPLMRVIGRDGYGSARVLLHSVRDRVQQELGGPAVWALPARDELWAAPAADADAVTNLRTLAAERFSRAHRPLTRSLVRVKDGHLAMLDEC